MADNVLSSTIYTLNHSFLAKHDEVHILKPRKQAQGVISNSVRQYNFNILTPDLDIPHCLLGQRHHKVQAGSLVGLGYTFHKSDFSFAFLFDPSGSQIFLISSFQLRCSPQIS